MRIQIELDERGVYIMSEIKKDADRPDMSHREFFDNAIAFLSWAVQQIKHGKSIAALDADQKNFQEVTMPLFDRVRAKVTPKVQAARV